MLQPFAVGVVHHTTLVGKELLISSAGAILFAPFPQAIVNSSFRSLMSNSHRCTLSALLTPSHHHGLPACLHCASSRHQEFNAQTLRFASKEKHRYMQKMVTQKTCCQAVLQSQPERR